MTVRCSGSAAVAWIVVLLSGLVLCVVVLTQEPASKKIWVLSLQGPIGPATSDHVYRWLSEADPARVAAVVLQIDIPGELDTSVLSIVDAILTSSVPVVGYLAPRGDRAASTGTVILHAAQVAAMAPATPAGSATSAQISSLSSPIRQSGDLSQRADDDGGSEMAESHSTLAESVVNGAVAPVRALAQLHKRNVQWAGMAVTEAASMSADAALREGVIDLVAENIDELLMKLDGRVVPMSGRKVILDTSNATVSYRDLDWRTELLATITNSTVTYVLLLLGCIGLLFEFWNPGRVGPGVIGGISLLLGLYALQLLSINLTGLLLITLGLAFMASGFFNPSFGIARLGGLLAFITGSILLLDAHTLPYAMYHWFVATIATQASG